MVEPGDHDVLVPGPRTPVSDLVDLAMATAVQSARLAGKVAGAGARIASPALELAMRPPLVPHRLQPGNGVQVMVERLQRDSPENPRALEHWTETVLPGAVGATLAQLDVRRLLVSLLDRIDLDSLVNDVIRRLDLKRVVAGALERLDLTAIVVDQVDLGGVVSAALDQVDLAAIVVDQLDPGRVVSAALDQVDIPAIVVDQVDLGRVVSTALKQLDLTQIVLHEVNLIGVADYVVEGIDLPGIIRESTGSVASEAVRGLRLPGAGADLVVGRVVDLVRHRTVGRRT